MDSSRSERKMSPADFLKLHDYVRTYCSRSVKDVLVQLKASGALKMENDEKNSTAQISYSGYKLLMRSYIEADVPSSLLHGFFLEFATRSWGFGGDEERGVKWTANKGRGSGIGGGGGTGKETLGQFIRRLQGLSKVVLAMPQTSCTEGISKSGEAETVRTSMSDEEGDGGGRNGAEYISVKELLCCLSLLEAGSPKDKLEFVFKVYDADGNGYLDAKELEHIVDQMMTIAENMEWDVSALKPILERMMRSMDANSDGKVSLTEWKNAGLTTVPLLALLGMETSDEGCHKFVMKHFNRPTYCNRCRRLLFGLRKQGLSCIYCKFTVHEQCAVLEVLQGCIATFHSLIDTPQELNPHHWVEGNFSRKCSQCSKAVTNLTGLAGQHCRWCQRTVHDNCLQSVNHECDFGDLHQHILRPSSLYSPNPACALDLQMEPTPGVVPLLVLVNPKSGGKQGSKLMRVFKYLLNPRQVFDLGHGGPAPGLNFFKDVGNFRVICCGGDGTVGWLLEEMDKIQFLLGPPPVSILPLGTGNDLARCLGWGGGYEGEDLNEILQLINQSHIVRMDRWRIEVEPLKDAPQDDVDDEVDRIPNNIMNNYFSIGVDASIALRFHNLREKHPEKFNSRTRNKLWYLECGTVETLRSTFRNLRENVEIECDGVPLALTETPSLECIAVLNIGSVYGGTDLWGGTSEGQRKSEVGLNIKFYPSDPGKDPEAMKDIDLAKVEQDLGDGLLEVVGLDSCFHLAQVKSGIQKGKRLCQCSKITIRTKQKFPMQVDGEPWIQAPCQISIGHHNQASVLMSPSHHRRLSRTP